MSCRHRILNISLIIIIVMLGGVTAYTWLSLRQHIYVEDKDAIADDSNRNATTNHSIDTIYIEKGSDMARMQDSIALAASHDETNTDVRETGNDVRITRFKEADLRKMVADHPFAKEAQKVVSGKLDVPDSLRRRNILNYCEHFRTAYNTKDIDFLRQVFSENALIIVGHTVKTGKNVNVDSHENERVRLSVQSKHTYLERLAKVFASNENIDVKFSDFQIMRHPTLPEIYGVTLRQQYSSDKYSDDGWLFLLWDFRNPSMPQIHVRTWQPGEFVKSDDDVVGIRDFYIE